MVTMSSACRTSLLNDHLGLDYLYMQVFRYRLQYFICKFLAMSNGGYRVTVRWVYRDQYQWRARSSSSHHVADPKPPQKPAKDADVSFVRMLRPPGCNVIDTEASIPRRLFWMGYVYWLHMSAHSRTKNSSLTRSRDLPDTITERTE
jgi:hypothetical protein